MSNAFTSLGKTVTDGLNRLSGWLLLLAIIWLCWGLARIVWLVLAPPQVPNLQLAELQVRQAPQVNASTALAIFESNNSAAPQEKPPNVNLTGVMLATPSEFSSAMLEVNGVMANYRIGEALEETNYTLVDVAWNQVIIADASNRQIVIDMPQRMPLDQGNAGIETEKGNIRNRRLPNSRNATNATSGPGLVPRNRDEENTGDRHQNEGAEEQIGDADRGPALENTLKPSVATAIDKASSELKSNPASYLSSMGVMASGDGYQVTDAMPEKIRNRLGLETGDKVLSVNGQSVGANPAGDADLLNQVKQSGQATIEVQRGDQTITIRQQF